MRFDETYSGNVFIKSHQNYEEAKAVLYGMPMDWTVSFRPGSRFGPARIREVSVGLEEYSPYLDRELDEVKFFDAGDIPLPFGNAQKALDEIEKLRKKTVALCLKTSILFLYEIFCFSRQPCTSDEIVICLNL